MAVAATVLAGSAAYYLTSTYDGPLMVAVVGTGLGTMAGNRDVNGVSVLMLAGWLVAMVALGRLRHSRLAHAREAERRAATEERLRIARELHDVIGHHISLVNVQSAAALRRLRKNPAIGAEQAEEALGAIKESSREALRLDCGPPSAYCARRTSGRPRHPRPAWTGSPTSPPRPAAPASTSAPASAATPGRCPPRWTSPRTASSRRPSPTSPATPAPPPSRSTSTEAPAS